MKRDSEVARQLDAAIMRLQIAARRAKNAAIDARAARSEEAPTLPQFPPNRKLREGD